MKVENEQKERMESAMKKLMVTWFVLCMIGVLLPDITAKAATEGDYEYTILEDDTAEITKYNGTATALTIPDTLGGKPVTRIADMAFYVKVEVSPGVYTDASTVTSVVFPETLTYIGNWNFCQLTSIHIPASLTTISSRAFEMGNVESITVDENNAVYDSRDNCNAIIWEGIDAETGVNKVELVLGCNTSTIPYGVTCIGSDAFSGCTFETITIPESVTEIGYCAFSNCGMSNLTIPDSVTRIGSIAFSGCDNLNVEIPASVTYIGDGAFSGCADITIDEDNTVYDSRNNCHAIIEKEYVDTASGETFVKLLVGTAKTVIPSDVEIIGSCAFSNCTALTTFEIPSGISVIENQTFYGCENLKEITIPDSVTYIGFGAFYGCSSLESIDIPSGVTTLGHAAFVGCTSLEEITLPSGIYEIGSRTFDGCSKLKDITVPSGVTYIGGEAFYGCSELASVTIPSSVEEIYEDAFDECSDKLKICAEPGSYAEKWAKEHNISVEYIPVKQGSMLTVESAKCKVEILSVDSNNPTVAYMGTTDETATTIVVPDTVTIGDVTYKVVSIGKDAFEESDVITKVTVGNNVTIIEEYAFGWCTSLEEVVLGASVKSISETAFEGVTDESEEPSLKLTIPETLEDVSGIGIENIINIQYIIIYVVDGGKAENYFQTFNYITINVYPPQQPSTDNEQPSTDTQQPPADTQQPPADTQQTVVVGKQYTVKNLKYKVTSAKNVMVVGVAKKKITKITIPAQVTILGASFKVTEVGKKAFKKCDKLKTVVIGSNVKTIGDEAFMKCTALKKITIGKNVKTIGKKAFYGDKKLKNIIFKGTKVTKIGKKAMKGVSGVKVKVPNNKTKNKYTKLLRKAK